MNLKFTEPLNNLDYIPKVRESNSVKPKTTSGHKRKPLQTSTQVYSVSLRPVYNGLPSMTSFFKEMPCNVNKINVGGRTRVIVPRFDENTTAEEREMYCAMNNTVHEEIIQQLSANNLTNDNSMIDTQQPDLIQPGMPDTGQPDLSLRIFDSHALPDPADPYFYCCVCDRTYRNNVSFRAHLQKIHNMTLEPSILCPPELLPDPEDPDFYCRSCRRKYRGKKNYRFHLQHIHFMRIEDSHMPKVYPDIVIDVNDPKNSCCIYCKTKYSDGDHYRRHMEKIHKNGRTQPVKGKPQVNPNITPDLYDPNFYCKSCNVAMRKRHAYRYHLFSMHDIQTVD